MSKPQDPLSLAQTAPHYAKTIADTVRYKDVLHVGYQASRSKTQNVEYIPRRSDAWNTMMLATAGECQQLHQAKNGEWLAKQKLLLLAKHWESM